MSLNTTTLFTRLGGLISTLDATVNAYRGTDLPARVAAIRGLYASPDLDILDGLSARLTAAQSTAGGFAGYLRQLARTTVIRMVNEAAVQADQGLPTALNYVIAYMVANSQTLQRNAVGQSVAAGGANTGTGNLLVGLLDNRGNPREYAFAEVLQGACTSDAQSGGATSGQETWGFVGQYGVTDALSWLYPAAGSNSGIALQSVDASSYGNSGTRNQLVNGDMEGWTSNVPTNWHITTGTAGTTVRQSTAEHYDGASSLRITGDGSELTSLYTGLGTDTVADPIPLDQLAVSFRLKVSSVPSAGVLTVQLVDGTGAQIDDDAGNASAFTVSLPGATTSWVAHGGFLRTPRVLPTTVRLRLKLTTALDNTVDLFLDHIGMAQPVTAYLGGPALAVFSGSTPWIAGDTFAATVTNDFGGLLQSGSDRLLGMRNLGLIFPSVASSPSISDALVT